MRMTWGQLWDVLDVRVGRSRRVRGAMPKMMDAGQ
jgi:hypothetical protein